MTREDLIFYLSEHLGWTELNTTKAVEAFLDTVVEELIAGNRVDIGGFGLFQARKQSEYILVKREENERYLMPPSIEIVFEAAEAVDVPDTSDTPGFLRDTIRFIPDESIEKEVNSSFMLFEPTLLNEGVQFPGLLEVYDDERKDENTGMQQAVVEGEPEKAPEEKPEDEGVRTSESASKTRSEDEIVKVSEEVSEAAIPEAVSIGKPEKETEKSIEKVPVSKASVSGKKRKKGSSIWMPVIGGVAIALAVLFFSRPCETIR